MVNHMQNSGIVPLIQSSSQISSLNLEEEMRVQEMVRVKGLDLITDCLDEYMHQMHDDERKSLQSVLDRITRIYAQIFPTSSLLNPSFESLRFLDDKKEIELAFKQTDQIYETYKKECIEEIFPKIPSYICKKLKLEKKYLPSIQKIIENTATDLKEKFLDPAFYMHSLGAKCIIHYCLGIPKSAPNSTTCFTLRNILPFHLLSNMS